MTVSRVAGELDEKPAVFRGRRLDHASWPYLMIDARCQKVRVEGRVVSQAVLVLVGFTSGGRREVLHWAVGDSESESHWSEVFRNLKDRGLSGVKLVASDAHQGIRSALSRHFQGVCRQRCRAHFKREMGRKASCKQMKGLMSDLAVLGVPTHHRRKLASTNLLENMMKRLKKRTRVVGIFPNRASCDRLIGAQLIELHEGWQEEEKACFNMDYAGT